MSTRSSLCSESAASELDPYFRSLKETPTCHHSSIRSPSSNPPYSPRSSVDSPLSIPANVNFPLPPRRLRPGEIVGITDLESTASPPADHSATASTPASLYGVAIGGSNPTKANPTINGRAEVQTDGLTSLDLRKMTLRARMADSQAGHVRPPAETVNLRARNPSRMLPPHYLAIQSPSRYNAHPSNPQNSTHYLSTHAQDPIGMVTPLVPHLRDLSRPPRNHSFLESTTTPIPRLPPRLPYQSLSYHLSNAYELPYQTLASVKQPLGDALSASSNLQQPCQKDFTSSEVNSSVSQNRIKFAPLPNKPHPLAYPVGSRQILPDSEHGKSKQFSKKKAAWIARWFSTNPTQASKNVPNNRVRREISLPVPQTLVITGTGTSPTNAMGPALPIRRRSSVNDQPTYKDLPSESQRPRSRSFTSARPTLGMMANMVQRSPSRSVQETLVSGKTLLNGSQHIRSPTRTQSLRNLIAENSNTSPSGKSNLGPGKSSNHTPTFQNTSMSGFVTKSANAQEAMIDVPPDHLSGLSKLPIEQHDNSKSLESLKQQQGSANVKHTDEGLTDEGGAIRKVRKKREIRFRNTLELIPDPVFQDSPEILIPAPGDTTSESSKSAAPSSDNKALDPSKRKPPARNLNPFSHLRRPRTTESDRDDVHYSTTPSYGTGQKSRQSNARSDLSLPNGPTKHNNLTLSRNHLDAENNENINLCARKLAPKINLTFVDLDHHIGSRFSVNTLFKEVQKSLPDVIPKEETSFGDSAGSEFDAINQTEKQLTRRERPELTNEDRSEGKDGSSSDTLESPTTTTSLSNPVDSVTSHPYSGHNSVIEVVKTNGADVVFQMVVPMQSSGTKRANSSERTETGLALKDAAYHSLKGDSPEHEEDDLTVISERLVALNKSIQDREARSISSEIKQIDDPSSLPSNTLANNLSTSKRRINRIENWLSNVPSPLGSPMNKVLPTGPSPNNSSQFLTVEKDELETLEYPESPIDRHHIPSRPLLRTS